MRYDEYKDSGVEWIGEVPSHWTKCRFKDFMKLQTIPSTSETKIGLENIESSTGKYIATDSEFEGNGIAFSIGDIVYGKLRPYLQKVWMASFDGNAVGDFFVFRVYKENSGSYIKYLMLSDGFTKEVDGSTFGAKMPRVASSFIQSMRYYLPTPGEQRAIATYLDTECGKIDEMIAKQNKRIALLQELKQSIITTAVTRGLNPNVEFMDSGVEWIGKIPKHWGKAEIKRYATIKTGTTPSTQIDAYYESEDINWFTPGDIENTELKDSGKKISNKAKDENACRIFPPHTIYFVGIGATIGKVSYCESEGSCNQQINAIITDNKNMYYKYLTYCLKSQKDEIYLSANLVTLPIINQQRTGSLIAPIPPLPEQCAIADHLDKQCARIDSLISAQEKRTALLQELKQSLITEVVTGKRKVC